MKRQSEGTRLLISEPGTFPGPGQRPFYREYNRSSIFVAFVFSLPRGFEAPLPCYLACLCNQRYQSLRQRYQLLKNQSGQLWPAGSFFCPALRGQVYDSITDNDDETLLLVGPLTLREAIVPNNANKPKACSLAPPPLPEYVVEVAP